MKSRWLVLALAGPVLAQPSTTFSVDVNLVRVPCIVTRANGAPVKNLRKEDFIVLEDGKPRRGPRRESESLGRAAICVGHSAGRGPAGACPA